jgi:hypothetical protein
MKTDFKSWWDHNETAWLYMELRPESGKFGKHCSGSGRYIWKVTGSGPGIDEDCKVYLDPLTMTICEKKVKQLKQVRRDSILFIKTCGFLY